MEENRQPTKCRHFDSPRCPDNNHPAIEAHKVKPFYGKVKYLTSEQSEEAIKICAQCNKYQSE